MARVALGEALTNLAAAPLSRWADIKLQANWMWPGRNGPAAAALYQAVEALRDALLELGLALDGGKDSLSMAIETAGGGERVPSPPTVVLTAYAPCVDVGGVVTPDIKVPFEEGEEGVLLHVDLSGRGLEEGPRLGGSALAQVLVAERGGAMGAMPSSFTRPPDLRDPPQFRRAFKAVQRLLAQRGPTGAGEIIRAMHDVSAGGLIATVLEMALAGGGGARVTVPVPAATPAGSSVEAARAWLFGEELGWVLEVRRADLPAVERALSEAAVPHRVIGASTRKEELEVVVVEGRGRGRGEVLLLREGMATVRAAWEATSLRLERLQANPACVAAEERCVRVCGGKCVCVGVEGCERYSIIRCIAIAIRRGVLTSLLRFYPRELPTTGVSPTSAGPCGTSPSVSSPPRPAQAPLAATASSTTRAAPAAPAWEFCGSKGATGTGRWRRRSRLRGSRRGI